MKKSSGSTLRIALIFCDAFVIILSFAAAYFFRTHLDSRPFFFEVQIWDFLSQVALLVPVWLIILAALGVYKKNIFLGNHRTPEILRLLLASALGITTMVSIGYFLNIDFFPVRIVALLSMVLCFIFLIFIRSFLRFVRYLILARDSNNKLEIIIVGNNKNTKYLAEQIINDPNLGYRIVGIVASAKYLPKNSKKLQFSSLKEALKKLNPDFIFQTDEHQTEYVYRQALNRHIPYYFVPSEAALSSQFGELELIGDTPAILVKVTPLTGAVNALKRFFDILLGSILLLLALIPIFILGLIIKISDPKHAAFYSEIRLTRHNKRFKIFKLRSMKPEYSGLSPEEAFKKMGKPELIKKYRKNGDYLEHDPRITKIGAFIRRTSLDELPQLWNVVKGDISLVGPRALVPGELRTYGNRSLILSVKSGLTGLAQVSGRRNITFEERRQLDIYYIQNWSLLLDFRILVKTIGTVFKREGAK